MIMDFFYRHAAGRMLLLFLEKNGCFQLASWFLKTKLSKWMIPRYIKKHQIDMTDYAEDSYDSFADFFVRSRASADFDPDPRILISPCDGLLSVCSVSQYMTVPVKGSVYRLEDLIPDRDTANLFHNGLCLIFRLQASDYHHFCFFDNAFLRDIHAVPGRLHSVQPVACAAVPVFRQNRRWWSVLQTEHFGTAVQIEVGAVLVGGITLVRSGEQYERGEEMGRFELAGSTIILLLNESVADKLTLFDPFRKAAGEMMEIPVRMGEGIGIMEKQH